MPFTTVKAGFVGTVEPTRNRGIRISGIVPGLAVVLLLPGWPGLGTFDDARDAGSWGAFRCRALDGGYRTRQRTPIGSSYRICHDDSKSFDCGLRIYCVARIGLGEPGFAADRNALRFVTEKRNVSVGGVGGSGLGVRQVIEIIRLSVRVGAGVKPWSTCRDSGRFLRSPRPKPYRLAPDDSG